MMYSKDYMKHESYKMNSQPEHSKLKLDGSVVPIVLTLNDGPLEVRKKSVNEPIYIDHL